MKERKKIGLALGSGGARGFCHLGVIQVFEENEIPIDAISGCSMGAIIGGCYSCGISVEKMQDLAKKISQFTVMDLNISSKNYGFLKGQRAIGIIKKLVGDKNIEDCQIPFAATSADMRSGDLYTFTAGPIIDAIKASMAIPAAFHAFKIDDKILVDGGIKERIPINAARNLGVDIVIAVDALGPIEQNYEPTGIADMIERAYLVLDWESTKDKLKEADLVITPDEGSRKLYVFKDNDFAIKQGRKMAEEMLPKIREIIK